MTQVIPRILHLTRQHQGLQGGMGVILFTKAATGFGTKRENIPEEYTVKINSGAQVRVPKGLRRAFSRQLTKVSFRHRVKQTCPINWTVDVVVQPP